MSGLRTDREQALAKPPPAIGKRKLGIGVAAFVVLGVVGALLGRHDSYHPPASSTTAIGPTAPVVIPSGTIPASLGAFIGVSPASGRAPGFALEDQHGSTVSLSSFAGKAVVLTFLDATGPDLSPVLAAEVVRADHDLGAKASKVAFVAIDTTASHSSQSALRAFCTAYGLSGMSNWYFLGGSGPRLSSVWSAYGISVSVDPNAPIVLHTEKIVFISGGGSER